MSAFRLSRETALLFARTTLRQTHKPHRALFDTATIYRPSQVPNLVFRCTRRRRLADFSLKRLFSSKPPSAPKYDPTPHLTSPNSSLSLSQRLRKLSREYGWSVFGVYLLLTALDFPFCFIAVRLLGTERIGVWEREIVEWVKRAIPVQIPAKWRREAQKTVLEAVEETAGETVAGYDHGVREAERANMGEKASEYTVLHFEGHATRYYIPAHLLSTSYVKALRLDTG